MQHIHPNRKKRVNETNFMAILVFAIAFALLLLGGFGLYAESTKPGKSSASVQAMIVDPEKSHGGATVQVNVTGVQLVDPAQATAKGDPAQAHLHYQLDGGPIMATTTTKMGFHNLTQGPHRVVITLADKDHKPLGPTAELNFEVK